MQGDRGALEAVWEGNRNKIRCDANDLELFLARVNCRQWLKTAGVVDVRLGDHGYPQGFARMEEVTLFLNSTDIFGVSFQANESEVYVLVVVPPARSTIDFDGTNSWQTIFHRDVVAATSLPAIGVLRKFVGRALPVKIELPKFMIDGWSLLLGADLRDTLFDEKDRSPCENS
ncbi:hypothetical protein F441_03949 [Phytophthora nicotianae CJ01A1]|uniref:Uncharacterized protein n=6 Tax=Phytophthora nicotianae TaxID=4792 RepID=W2QIV6_PHYN3|nr:hypothetical protein PPTG_08021 [Phytophthora nicotianae INRA-310]ETI53052.1 hypothetical protein F443_03967 [Phytophthora nicotianae P1569]ETL99448.1 hypothetical protein L917_03712 [Phytophthora nicotianae]ETO81725.1 hypothetical protein F444_04024 [Phytophthora nicotianae P1976]ETP22845.1 hypothetical protein F441_03949 [Phytophthora nicotianae CJ01A1]ETP50821.1 hypothetical protein F442_03953 [Phytophthora nicotianae P10297]